MGSFIVMGYNPSATNSDMDIWPQNIIRTDPTTAVKLGISSNSANDAAAGTGARTVNILGVGSNWAELSETVTLTGTTKVETSGTYFRLNGMKVMTAGSAWATNAGIIYAADTGDTFTAGVPQTATKIFGRIVVGDNVTTQAMVTVPDGQSWVLRKVIVHPATANATARYGTVFLTRHCGVCNIKKRFYLGGISTTAGPLVWFPKGGLRIPSRTTLALRFLGSGAAPVVGIMEFDKMLDETDIVI
jgi:hypothetical protein